MWRNRLAALIAVLALTAPLVRAESPAALAELTQSRETMAAALAGQAAYCSSQRDTDHITFSGCIDWHSAVHGVWALVAYQLATGDDRHADLVARMLVPDKIAGERAFLAERPRFEMPYGRAWFLRLAMDAERLGIETLGPMADEVAASLLAYLRDGEIDPYSGAYDSQSWALINLFDHYAYRGDGLGLAQVEQMILSAFGRDTPRCRHEDEEPGFMAICSNWMALMARVLDGDSYADWLDRFIAANGLPRPVTRPRTAHHYGLNFSRAWGLWDAWAASGREDVAEAYVAHLLAGFLPESNWTGDYGSVGHWVAQFGMFALQPLFGPEKGR